MSRAPCFGYHSNDSRAVSHASSRVGAQTAMVNVDDEGMLELLTLEYLAETGACVLGTPDDCTELCRRYEEAGVDLLLCLVNPYKIPHDAVMQTIEMMGEHVIPEFR